MGLRRRQALTRNQPATGEGLGWWRDSVLSRDKTCRLGFLGDCSGELQAHHVVYRSRDRSRVMDVHNGAALCAAHHGWVHANSRRAREQWGLTGHSSDVVRDGKVVAPDVAVSDVISALAAELARSRPRPQ